MIKDLQFTLLSDPQRFEAWLERYRLKTLPLDLPFTAGKKLWVFNLPTFRRADQQVRTHLVEAAIIRPVPLCPDKIELFDRFPVVEIRIFELSQGRLNFELDCLHHQLIRFCWGIMEDFEKYWPETRGQLHRPLNRLLNAEDNPYGRKIDNFLDEVRETSLNGIVLYPDQWASLNTPAPERLPSGVPESGVAPSLPSAGPQDNRQWAQLSEATKSKFRKAWKIYQEMSRQYQNDVLDGLSTRSKPTVTDFRDRILVKMKWNISERRLRDVIRLGESGQIK